MRFSFADLFIAFLQRFSARHVDVDVGAEPTARQALPAAALTLVSRPISTTTLGIDTVTGVPVMIPTVSAPELSGRQWFDLIGEPRGDRGKAHGTRDWSKIKGLTIHQTAVDFGTNPRRVLDVPVHGCTLSDGSVVLLHDPRDYMWHAHSFNKYDIGIEVSCRAAGIEGNGESLWLPKEVWVDGVKVKSKSLTNEERLEHASEATDTQLEATKELITYYVELVAKNGGKLEFIHAHRQSSKSRTSDPGERIWREVALWAMETHGLTSGPADFTSGGYAIPDVWSGEANGIRYNWRIDGRIKDDNA